ncbi:MAG: peptidoglycan-binding protein, partial [Bifidobacteriaceae bacterium]|nr:peptidoglycan-binding protein [Bifidobacteriaceae bacterium]
VVAEQIDDARAVELVATAGQSAELATPAEGKVTSIVCEPGDPWRPGETNLSLDGRPVVNLATSTPLWRDLAKDAKGEDVKALQVALKALGHDLEPNGRYGPATARAVKALLADIGVKADGSALALAEVLWLPAKESAPAQCLVSPGQILEAAQVVAKTVAPLTSVRVKDLPRDLVAGARVLELPDNVTVPLGEDGSVDDAADLATLAATASYRAVTAASAEEGSQPWQARARLAEPVTVHPVPPAAIKMTDGRNGCVAPKDAEPRPVEVVASEMGRSFVVFTDGRAAPGEVSLAPTKELTCA